MTSKIINLTPALYAYVLDSSLRELPLLVKLRDETARRKDAGMQIAPDQGQFMALLVRLIGAKSCIEIGTFTGYSALCVALAIPADGRIICCDVNPETTAVARRYWNEAGVASKIDLRIAPARETLAALLMAGSAGTFDFAFIDADKESYESYYESCLRLVRPGGLIAIDNVLWSGAVVDSSRNDADTQAIRALNAAIRNDERVDCSLLPIADGLMLARKR